MSKITATVTMVGPTGVGKTSFLAAMYHEAKSVFNQFGCTFVCEGTTKKALSDRLLEIKALSSGKTLRIANDVGIGGSTDKREYNFTILVPVGNEKLEIELKFVDMPGGWFSGTGNYEEAQRVLAASNVSFWCVDCTALMEGELDKEGLGEYHGFINEPESVFDCYQTSVKTLNDSHRVHFILMRSETYVNKETKGIWATFKALIEGSKRKTLIKRFLNAYLPFVERLRKLKSGGSISASGSTVQTVGNVAFHTFEESADGKPRAVFLRDTAQGYSPSGCTSPIAVALSQGLIKHLYRLADEQKEIAKEIKHTKKKHQQLISKYKDAETQAKSKDYGLLNPVTDIFTKRQNYIDRASAAADDADRQYEVLSNSQAEQQRLGELFQKVADKLEEIKSALQEEDFIEL